MFIKKSQRIKCKIKRTKEKKNPNIIFLQYSKLLCTKCGRTKELVNNYMKAKATSKQKNVKQKTMHMCC
jgi:hypothetical protein